VQGQVPSFLAGHCLPLILLLLPLLLLLLAGGACLLACSPSLILLLLLTTNHAVICRSVPGWAAEPRQLHDALWCMFAGVLPVIHPAAAAFDACRSAPRWCRARCCPSWLHDCWKAACYSSCCCCCWCC
jgi:hypothetical protein